MKKLTEYLTEVHVNYNPGSVVAMCASTILNTQMMVKLGFSEEKPIKNEKEFRNSLEDACKNVCRDKKVDYDETVKAIDAFMTDKKDTIAKMFN